MRKLLNFPLLVLALFILSFLITLGLSGNHTSSNSFIEIGAAPLGASATINGHGASIGKNEVNPGSYTVTVSMKGFASQSQSVSVSMNKSVFVGVSLTPNSADTQNWYATHPSDQTLSDAVGSKLSDYESSTALQNNPFLKQLPLSYGDGLGGFISISQGVPTTTNGPPAVYVRAASPGLRQSVLAYMRNRGYDPANMDIVFYDQVAPLQYTNSGDKGE